MRQIGLKPTNNEMRILKSFLVLTLLTTSLDAWSQSDTITVSRSGLIRRFIQIERLKADSAEAVRRTAEVADQKKVIDGQVVRIVGLEKENDLVNRQNIVLLSDNKNLKKQNKLTLIGAGLIIGLLIIKK